MLREVFLERDLRFLCDFATVSLGHFAELLPVNNGDTDSPCRMFVSIFWLRSRLLLWRCHEIHGSYLAALSLSHSSTCSLR